MRTWKFVNQQYSAWSDYMDVKAGLVSILVEKADHFGFQQDKG